MRDSSRRGTGRSRVRGAVRGGAGRRGRVIGDLVQAGVTQNDLSVTGDVIVISTIGALQVLTSYLSYRFRRIRPVLQGEPIVLVESGQLIKRNMDRERLTLDDLAEQARLNDIASVDDIRWAILETNGQISFIK